MEDKYKQIKEKKKQSSIIVKDYFKFTINITNKTYHLVHFLCESILDNLGYHRPGANCADMYIWKVGQLSSERIKETLRTTQIVIRMKVCGNLP